ncbi:peptide methionine sulfoxide reductase B5-like isoform X2 [Telopea speciosissima]|uniref:peptide methionine sulfoxide reductase B5-like isoform X2 n=1 Tax=Telopea speciosissima TaxID=54955 RepID=UPI001CC4EC66|nr:peptide methionine sulfoxide reductase B5-like isoform X2 [Telopea speciosissima]
MGVQLLKITAFSSPRILIINPKAPVSRFLGHIDSSGKSTFHLLCKTQYHESPLTPKSLTSSATGFPACFYRSRRSFRGGVVAMAATGSVQKSEEEWQAILSPEQFRILRQKGTEFPGTGEYDKFFGEGIYNCAGCGTPLYRSTTKFDSGCGWPAFFEGLPGAINRTADPDGRRIEITCAACGGHLGHVFKGEGFPTPTDERHCVNSISVKFVPASSE